MMSNKYFYGSNRVLAVIFVFTVLLSLSVGCKSVQGGRGTQELQPFATLKPIIPNDEVLVHFLPGGGWKVVQKKLINISQDMVYLVVGASRKFSNDIGDNRITEVFVLHWTEQNIENPWLKIWGSPLVSSSLSECVEESVTFYSIKSIEAALVVANFGLGGAKGISHTIAFTIGPCGDVRLHKAVDTGISNIETTSETILVIAEAENYKFSIDNGQINIQTIKRSEMIEPTAIRLYFLLGCRGVVAAINQTIVVSVGDTIGFAPQNEITAKAFNAGEIQIYTDAWNGPPLNASESNRLKRGNSYTFLQTGLVHFYLSSKHSHNNADWSEPKHTFAIMVMP